MIGALRRLQAQLSCVFSITTFDHYQIHSVAKKKNTVFTT